MVRPIIATTEVLDAIRGGILDSEVEEIVRVAKNRKNTIEGRKTSCLTQGDKLRFNDKVVPKYLAGKEVTFERMAKKNLIVSCPDDPSYGDFKNSQNVICSLNILDVS